VRRSPLALLLATVAAGAFPGPAEAISRSGADLIATRVLGLKHQHRPHAVWRWPSPVSARTVITEPGPGHLEAQATRVVISAQGTALVTPLTRRRIGRRVWLYWEDLLPAAMFPHPSTLLLLDARSGRVVRRVSLAWWPLLNGGSPFVRGVRAGPAAPRVRSARRSYAGATAASPGPAGSRVIEIGDFQAPDTAPNFAAWSQYALTTTGKDALRAHSRAELAASIASAYRDGARDVQIYANGHQFVPIGFLDLLGRGQNWINRTIAGGGWGPSISLSSTPGLGHTWKQAVLTAADLRGVILQAKQQFPGLTVSVVVETCGAGNFGPSLEGAADRYITSVTSGKFSMAPPRDGSAPSPFSGAAINAVRSVIPRDRGASLTDAIGSVEPTIANDTTAAAMQRDGGTYPQEPTYDRQVSGRIIQCPALYAYVPDDDPRHCSRPSGKVVVRVSLGFSLDAKSSGTVMISPAAITVSSSSPPPSFGNPALGDVFFYAAPNTEVKLTANHGANSYFDGWQVHNGGRCMPPTATPSDMIGGGSPGSCTLIARDRGDGRAAVDGFAFFLTCPPPGTHFARHGAAIDCPGVTEGR
jgi:hypothetical protein